MKLNLGCGKKKKDGFINIDISNKCKPDFVWDLTKTPYPREWTKDVDYIFADNLLEHFNPDTVIRVLNEWNRILKRGGQCEIIVPTIQPDFKSLNRVFSDPTHKSYFTSNTFDYIDKENQRWKNFGKDYGLKSWTIKSKKEEGQLNIILEK